MPTTKELLARIEDLQRRLRTEAGNEAPDEELERALVRCGPVFERRARLDLTGLVEEVANEVTGQASREDSKVWKALRKTK